MKIRSTRRRGLIEKIQEGLLLFNSKPNGSMDISSVEKSMEGCMVSKLGFSNYADWAK